MQLIIVFYSAVAVHLACGSVCFQSFPSHIINITSSEINTYHMVQKGDTLFYFYYYSGKYIHQFKQCFYASTQCNVAKGIMFFTATKLVVLVVLVVVITF